MKLNFKLNILIFLLANIFCLSAMEKEIPTSYLEILPQDLKNQIELIKFISQAPYETVDQAIEIINNLRKLPRFAKLIDEQQTTNLIIESIASKLKLYQKKAFEIANKLGTPAALVWIEKRSAEIPIEEEFIQAPLYGLNKVNKFFNKKVNVNAQNEKGTTALMIAAIQGTLPIFNKTLNISGIDINLQTTDGHTALMFATHLDRAEIVKKLLEAGADWSIKNNLNETALDLAKKQSHLEIVAILEKAMTEKKEKFEKTESKELNLFKKLFNIFFEKRI